MPLQCSHLQKSYLVRTGVPFFKALGPCERLRDNSNFRVFPSLTALYIQNVFGGESGICFTKQLLLFNGWQQHSDTLS